MGEAVKTCYLLLMLGMVGLGFGQDVKPMPTPIKVSDVRGDAPEFKRRYEVMLPRRIRMKVEMHTFMRDRMDDSELTQADGKWVLFDVRSPADKILDREILPYVQQFAKEIIRMDAEYIRSRPAEFVDENGTRWRRVN
jgi:hypothetical protein